MAHWVGGMAHEDGDRIEVVVDVPPYPSTLVTGPPPSKSI